jgi:non-heme chloroperoxidase
MAAPTGLARPIRQPPIGERGCRMNAPTRDPDERAETAGTPTAVRRINLPTRLRLEYVEHGDPTGAPVLLLHGLADSWRSFEPVLPHLPASIRAFALSQRGHGDADRPAAGYGPRDFAADLAAFVDALGLGRAVVVGHSLGALVAQRFALDHPARTRGLVLVGWRGYPRPSAVAALGALEDPIDPGFVRAFQEASLARPVPPAFLDAMVRESLKVPARVWREVVAAVRADDFSAELGTIAAPTLIAWGDRDATCPRSEQEALAATIAGARLLVYPGAGHCLHWEEPARFAADLAAFAERVAG